MLSEKILEERNFVQGGSLQTNGIDLSIDKVYKFRSCGVVSKNEKTITPRLEKTDVDLNDDTHYFLPKGEYVVSVNESIELDLKTTALVFQRSSLARCGAVIHSSIWDAGFKGKDITLLLDVLTTRGIVIEKGARIAQMCFFRLEGTIDEGYSGQWQK